MAFLSKKQSLWRDGQSTIPFVSPDACLSKEKRFKHFSIYWPQKVTQNQVVKKKRSDTDEMARKISKLIDEEEKNEIRMNKANGSLKKLMSKTTGFNNASARQTFSNFRPTTTACLTTENQRIVQRLTEYKASQQSKLRDRHGNRANLHENQQDQVFNKLREEHRMRGTQKGFYTSRRVNLNLPHNYYPGPGTYEIKRYLQSKQANKKRSISLHRN